MPSSSLRPSPRSSRHRAAALAAALGMLAPIGVLAVAAPGAAAGYAVDDVALSGSPAVKVASVQGVATGAAYLDATQSTATRVEDLLGRMTQAEKIGQMTQAERGGAEVDQ